MDDNTRAVLLTLIPLIITMIGASIAQIAATMMAYFKARDAAVNADHAVSVSRENRLAIHEVGGQINGKMTELIEAREVIAHAAGVAAAQDGSSCRITVRDAARMDSQVLEIWRYLRSRALAEIAIKGLASLPNLEITEKVRTWYAKLAPELRDWYLRHGNLDDLDLFIKCHEDFGPRLIEEICEPYGLFDGACVQLAVLIARESTPCTPKDS